MFKRHLCKSKLHSYYHFLDIYENPRWKNFINLSCPKCPKVIEIRNDTNLNFYTSLPRKGFMNLFHEPKRSVKMKNLCHLLPLFGTTRVKTLIELPPYSISVSLILEAHKNLKYKNKLSLLAHYANLFSAPNFRTFFIIIVLQCSKYFQNLLWRYLVFSTSQSLYIRTFPFIRMITRFNTQRWNKLYSKQIFTRPFKVIPRTVARNNTT